MATMNIEDEALLRTELPPSKSVVLNSPVQTLFYRESGALDGIPIVLLHGMGSHGAEFRAQLSGLSDRFRLISWDAPGYGQSEPVASDDPDGDDFVSVLKDFCDSLGLEAFHLVGSSWGSVIASCFAARHPHSVRSLTLLAPNVAFGFLKGAEREAAVQQWLDPARMAGRDPESIARMLTAPGSSDLVIALAAALPAGITPRGFEQAVRMLSNVDTVNTLQGLQLPLLVIAGDSDLVAPIAQHATPIAAAVPGARLVVLTDVGHLVQLEAPTRVNRELEEFVMAQDAGVESGR